MSTYALARLSLSVCRAPYISTTSESYSMVKNIPLSGLYHKRCIESILQSVVPNAGSCPFSCQIKT